MWTWSVGRQLGQLGIGWGRLWGPTDHVHMLSPYFKGAESVSGLGLPQFLGFGSRFGVET